MEKLSVNEIIDSETRTVVGKIMKRLEILQQQDISYEQKEKLFKALVKELLYEYSRSIKWSLALYNKGYERQSITEFETR